MSGVLDRLKHAIVEDDAPVQNPAQTVATAMAPIPYRPSRDPVLPIAPGIVQPLDVSALRIKVAGAGPTSVFASMLKSLAAYIPDEASRYKAAKEALIGQGITVPALSTDIGSILGRLDAECSGFEAAKAHKVETDVTARETKLTEIDSQINQLKAERESVAVALVTAKQNIEKTEQNFMGAANALKSEYRDTLSKLKTFLGDTL